ncbi:MAG: M48 family metallopeptidase [Flavobacteriaceae bacterium]|nr:M48 family metallopeptidase [Flavobacteriaceae bacterium]
MNPKKILLTFLVLLIIMSCKTNPFTGKQTLNFVSNDKLFPMSFSQYNQVLSESKVITGTKDAEMITRVGERIKNAAERYLNANGHEGYLNAYEWEYKLIDSDQINAWAMPGGKIAFYTGILPIAKNEAGVAAIMGHEVAHALANHGAQRMSAAQVQQIGALAGNIAIGDEKSRNAFNQYYGVGTTVGGMLPFSRSHETEADQIGIYLMAIAGYNPDEAAELWQRMKEKSGGQAPPEILSTHPSNDSRIANLTALATQARAEAAKFGVTQFRN